MKMIRNRILLVLHFCISLTTAVVPHPAKEEVFTARSVGRSLAKCLGEPKLLSCLQIETVHNLDLLIRDNSTWQCSDFIEFEKDQNFNLSHDFISHRSGDSFGDEIAEKLVQLALARSVRLRINPRSLVAETKDLNMDEGGENERKYQKIWYLNDSLKGRKKKDKDKGMAMFGGLAMVAMMAQMFLGKVMLIAGSAFVMAKVALMVSLLTSLKTKSGGGGSTEHVVTYTDAGGGGGGHSGWHRSLPNYSHSVPAHSQVEEEHHSYQQVPEYYHYDGSTHKKDYKFI